MNLLEALAFVMMGYAVEWPVRGGTKRLTAEGSRIYEWWPGRRNRDLFEANINDWEAEWTLVPDTIQERPCALSAMPMFARYVADRINRAAKVGYDPIPCLNCGAFTLKGKTCETCGEEEK